MTHRVEHHELFEAEIARHNAVFRTAADIRPGERVLDIGCGVGQSTREAAETAESVLGVDVSPDLLELARSLSTDVGNLSYELGDAQVHDFPAAHFDVCISRFGSMFFADPVAAFGNIRRALRPGGRMVLLVWQSRTRNEWATAIDPDGPADGPFSLGHPATAEAVLVGAGFSDITFAEVHEPVYYGPDVNTAMELVRGFQCWQAEENLRSERLAETLAAHADDTGVHFDSRAWIITARS